MGYKYLLFDFDGNLANTLDVWLTEYKKLLKAYNIELDDKQIVHDFFGTAYVGPQKYKIDGAEFYGKLMPEVNKAVQNVQLHEGVREVLNVLQSQDKKMALVTTGEDEVIYPLLDKLDLKKYFPIVVTFDDIEKIKPDPEQVDKAMKLIGAVKEETIIIGDSDKDILAGKNAGIATCLFYPKANQKFYDREKWMALGADYVIEDFTELLEVV